MSRPLSFPTARLKYSVGLVKKSSRMLNTLRFFSSTALSLRLLVTVLKEVYYAT